MFIGTVALTSGISLVGWALALIGLSVSQSRYNELNIDAISKNPYSLSWFFLIFYLVTILAVMMANLKENILMFRHSLLHLTSISFVFVVLNLDANIKVISLFRGVTDTYLSGAGVASAGLIMMSLSMIHWLYAIGALEWIERAEEEMDAKVEDHNRTENMMVIAPAAEAMAAPAEEAVQESAPMQEVVVEAKE